MNNPREDNLIFEAYQQLNEWGEDLDPANKAIDVLKYRLQELEGQGPRMIAKDIHGVVDHILHMGKAVSPEEVEQVLRSQVRDMSGLGVPFNDQGRQEQPMFDDETIKQIMTPKSDRYDDGSQRARSAWEPQVPPTAG
jgi:hypothetical protein